MSAWTGFTFLSGYSTKDRLTLNLLNLINYNRITVFSANESVTGHTYRLIEPIGATFDKE